MEAAGPEAWRTWTLQRPRFPPRALRVPSLIIRTPVIAVIAILPGIAVPDNRNGQTPPNKTGTGRVYCC